jgi:hypothetical protein
MSYSTFGKRQSASATGMERRQSSRRRTSVDGKIILGSRKSLKCSIVDMSNTGALLAVASMRGIPETFKLEDDFGRKRAVRVARRGTVRIAVTFD